MNHTDRQPPLPFEWICPECFSTVGALTPGALRRGVEDHMAVCGRPYAHPYHRHPGRESEEGNGAA